MNKSKITGITRLVSFALIAVLLIICAGVAASGWQSDTNQEPDSGENGDVAENTDENKDGSSSDGSNDSADGAEIEAVKKYYSYLTGQEISEEDSRKMPVAFVTDTKAPSYAISSAELAIEIPTENGETKMIIYSTAPSLLGKIGSLAVSRPYISKMQDFFGGIFIYNGILDTPAEYFAAWEIGDAALDLSSVSGYAYTENTLYLYTNGDLISAGLQNAEISTALSTPPPLPFAHSDENNSATLGQAAGTVILPYSATNEVQLYYSEKDASYAYHRSGAPVIDLLNAKVVSFKNIFVLFADSKMYYTASGASLEMNTGSGGTGIYASGGKAIFINWCVTSSGELLFTTESGEAIVAPRGNSYIGYFISTNKSTVTIQ